MIMFFERFLPLWETVFFWPENFDFDKRHTRRQRRRRPSTRHTAEGKETQRSPCGALFQVTTSTTTDGFFRGDEEDDGFAWKHHRRSGPPSPLSSLQRRSSLQQDREEPPPHVHSPGTPPLPSLLSDYIIGNLRLLSRPTVQVHLFYFIFLCNFFF